MNERFIENIKDKAKENENSHVQKSIEDGVLLVKYAKTKVKTHLYRHSDKLNALLVYLHFEKAKGVSLDDKLAADITSYIEVMAKYWVDYAKTLGLEDVIFLKESDFSDDLNVANRLKGNYSETNLKLIRDYFSCFKQTFLFASLSERFLVHMNSYTTSLALLLKELKNRSIEVKGYQNVENSLILLLTPQVIPVKVQDKKYFLEFLHAENKVNLYTDKKKSSMHTSFQISQAILQDNRKEAFA